MGFANAAGPTKRKILKGVQSWSDTQAHMGFVNAVITTKWEILKVLKKPYTCTIGETNKYFPFSSYLLLYVSGTEVVR